MYVCGPGKVPMISNLWVGPETATIARQNLTWPPRFVQWLLLPRRRAASAPASPAALTTTSQATALVVSVAACIKHKHSFLCASMKHRNNKYIYQ